MSKAMKSCLSWMCKCRISACHLALALIWTCTSAHAGIPCENNCLQTVNHQADCEVIACRNGCKPGWYGSLCNKRCSRLCQDKICDLTDGKCTKGCKGRWFCKGSSRIRVQRDIDPVNKRCLRQNVDNHKTCECCTSGYRGPNCSILCENCETFENSDLCKYICKGGYYGDTCSMKCSKNCATGIVGTHLCEATGDGTVQCSNGCIRGRYGKYCSNSCSQSCKNNTCYIMDGTCVGCSDNRYGSYCNMSCSEKCINDRCQRNGTCIDGCKEGYSGLMCDRKCSVNCTGGLCYQNGTCWPSCENGFYGELCKVKCGKNCLNSSCQAQTGNGNLTFVCTHGCEDGYMGSQCQEQCKEHCTNCSKLPHSGACKHTPVNHGSVEKGSSRPLLWWHVVVPIVVIIIAVVIVIIVVISFKKRGHCFKRREKDGKPDVNEHLLKQKGTMTVQHTGDEEDHHRKDNRCRSVERHYSFNDIRERFDANAGDKQHQGTPAERSREKVKCKELNTRPTENRFPKIKILLADDKEENQNKDNCFRSVKRHHSFNDMLDIQFAERTRQKVKGKELNTRPTENRFPTTKISLADEKAENQNKDNRCRSVKRHYSFHDIRERFERGSFTDDNSGDKRQPCTLYTDKREQDQALRDDLNKPEGTRNKLETNWT